jgi:hypothetical protein
MLLSKVFRSCWAVPTTFKEILEFERNRFEYGSPTSSRVRWASPGLQQPIKDMIDVGELGFRLQGYTAVRIKGDVWSIPKAAHAGGEFVVFNQMRGLLHGFSSVPPSDLRVTSRVVDDETDDETDDDKGSGQHTSIDMSRLFTAKVTTPGPSHLVRPGRGRFHGPVRTQQHRCRQIGGT